MINHIDVSDALRRSVCHLYSDLVTRPTGAAVRQEIEQQLALLRERTLTVIDFTNVGLLDFSCADEVIAKLLLRYVSESAPHEGYFLFRGMREVHLDALEAVLERHRLALVVETDGAAQIVGEVSEGERRAWEALAQHGRCTADEVATALGVPLDTARGLLAALCRRRLAMTLEDAYAVVDGALARRRLQ